MTPSCGPRRPSPDRAASGVDGPGGAGRPGGERGVSEIVLLGGGVAGLYCIRARVELARTVTSFADRETTFVDRSQTIPLNVPTQGTQIVAAREKSEGFFKP